MMSAALSADRQADHIVTGAGGARCSAVNWRWVVEAGCNTSERVSPILAKWASNGSARRRPGRLRSRL